MAAPPPTDPHAPVMSHPATLGACLVLHDTAQMEPLFRRFREMCLGLQSRVELVLALTSSGGIAPQVARTRAQAASLEPTDCLVVDDRFFDFSAYRTVTALFRERGVGGALFVNDTLLTKHDSAHLRATLAGQIAALHAKPLPFPVLAGPYRHSEFSFGHGEFDHFVASFMFYLNEAGLQTFSDLLEGMPAVQAALVDPAAPHPSVDPGLLRFCRIHALQLAGRFNGRADAAERLSHKLATVYTERALSHRVRIDGVVWYTASGLVGRLLVPLQIALRRLTRRILPAR
jgi:hypothetical protein